MGILKTAATVAVASSVHGRIQRRQQARWAAQDHQANAAAAPARLPAAHGVAELRESQQRAAQAAAALRAARQLRSL